MRVIIVSREVPEGVSGVCLGPVARLSDADLRPRLLRGGGHPAFNAYSARRNEEELARVYLAGVRHGALRAAAQGEGAPVEVLGQPVTPSTAGVLGSALDYENECITVTGLNVALDALIYDARLLCGAFANRDQLKAVLEADGGTSRIHIFNRDVARRRFARQGEGVLEEGMYLEHPKRDRTLVPFKTFHEEMMQEMVQEARVVMGRIGARRMCIEATEGVSFDGGLISELSAVSGSVSIAGSRKRDVKFEWGSPTFEPDQALDGCVWIRDNMGVAKLVEQRRTSNLTRLEECSSINTTFNVSIDVVRLFRANFRWAKESKHRYTVEFFDRAAPAGASGSSRPTKRKQR